MAADELGEFERIQRYFVPLAGPGGLELADDAALLDCAPGRRLVVTADAIVARVHYLPDDLVWVSGTIGDAFLGLELLRGAHSDLEPEHRDYLVRRFRLPEPRTELGPRLCGIARAMIDVSDGLLADLGHICETSRAAAIVELDLLPLSLAARAIIEGDPGTRARLATAGDDYELVFAAPADATETIATLS